MKKIILLLTISTLLALASCESNSVNNTLQTQITLNFSHSWDGVPVTNTDFNSIKFTNDANGEQLSIERLRYLISNVTLTALNNEKLVLPGYNLVDLTNGTNLSFAPISTIPSGTYKNISFTFGFDNDANAKNHQDLNSASWGVPEMLGGGYHYMQLEGKFIDNTSTETGYAYHAIRAVNNSKTPQEFKDTFFEVNLGEVTITNNTTLNIEMNIAEWFKNPNTWDLNTLNSMLMPNFNAQVMMFENGQNVFSLESISP